MKRVSYILPLVLLLCVCGLLIASLQFGGVAMGGFQNVSGYGSQGIPPAGGSCANVGQVYADNPFQGWPADFRPCNWAVISAYYCTPHYFVGYTHYGIDLSNDWTSGNEAAIHGVPVLATANAVVAQAVFTMPAQWNYGMGNFVQLTAFESSCEVDLNLDLNNNGTVGDYCGGVCEDQINRDLNNDGAITNYCGEETGWKATYMHLLDITVQLGQIVRVGDVIGHINNSGNSTGDHLHYQINGPEGAIDPAPTFGCPGYDWQAGVNEGR